MRRKYVCVPTILVTLFVLYANFPTDSQNEYIPQKAAPRRSNIIERSVFVRYGNSDELTIFSAFSYHDRITIILSSYGYFARKVYCRYLDSEAREVQNAYATTVFPEFTVQCEPSSVATFIGVSINADDETDCMTKTRLIVRKDSQLYFAVCLAPIFGTDPKWLLLTEFLEYYRLQGAEQFFVYTKDSDSQTDQILESYQRENLIETIRIGNETKCLSRHRCRHEMQLQDCIARSRHFAHWVATVDLDERIYPVNPDINLKQLIRSNERENIGEFRFRCRWVLRYEDVPMSVSSHLNYVKEELPTLKWHNTSHVAPINHTTKSIVNPTKVESMGVHQVLRFVPNAEVKLVNPEDAVVRHYRLQRGWSHFLREAEGFGSFENTSIASSLMDSLTGAVLNRIGETYGIT